MHHCTRLFVVFICLSCFAVVTLCTGAATAQELPEMGDLSKIAGFVRWSGVVVSVFIVVLASVALRFVSSAADRLGERFTNRRLLVQKVESFARFFIYLSAVLLVVALSFQINEQTLKYIAGALAFTIGFAMRDLVAAVIAGITIMFDRPFQVGDRVKYAGEYGDIIQIGLRSVRMRTLNDNIVTIPNNKILTDVTASGNYGSLHMQLQMDFYVGADQDVEVAERLLKEAMLTSRYVHLEMPVVVRVKQEIVADMVVVTMRGKAYVLDTKYEKALETDVSKRVLRAFRIHGVLPPASFERAARIDPLAAEAS